MQLNSTEVFNRLTNLISAQKDEHWIQSDLTLEKSSLIGRIFWAVAKRFDFLREAYGVNLDKSQALLRQYRPIVAEDRTLALTYNAAVASFNRVVSKKHQVETVEVPVKKEESQTHSTEPQQAPVQTTQVQKPDQSAAPVPTAQIQKSDQTEAPVPTAQVKYPTNVFSVPFKIIFKENNVDMNITTQKEQDELIAYLRTRVNKELVLNNEELVFNLEGYSFEDDRNGFFKKIWEFCDFSYWKNEYAIRPIDQRIPQHIRLHYINFI